VKGAVEAALAELGWARPQWYTDIKTVMASWGSVDGATDALSRGGMVPLLVEHRAISFPDHTACDMVAWRMGLAQHASFLDSLDATGRAAAFDRALELLGPDPAPLVRRVIFLTATH